MGEGAGGRGVFGLSAGAGLAPACLWHVLRLVRGEEDPSSAAARAATPSPHKGKAFGAGHGVLMDHERKRPDLLRVRPLFYSFSNR